MGEEDDGYKLEMVVMVSRHGIRSPFAPPYGTVNDYTPYTNRPFPGFLSFSSSFFFFFLLSFFLPPPFPHPSLSDNNTWGMTQKAFSNQYITPHGKEVIPLMGAYYREVKEGKEERRRKQKNTFPPTNNKNNRLSMMVVLFLLILVIILSVSLILVQ